MKPEVVNSRLKTFTVGDTLQGEISSIEDEGIIVDLGRGEESRGFLPKAAYAEADRLVIGKSTSFRVTEVLLDGRQITLEIPRDAETVSSVSRLENLAPGQFVTFNSARQQKSGLVGRVFEFGATLHILQSEEDMLDTVDAQRIIPTRIIMIDYENKRIILGNNTNVMSTEPLKAVKCRNGEIVEAQIEESDGYGLILFDAQTQSRLYCPFYNITEEQESVIFSKVSAGLKRSACHYRN